MCGYGREHSVTWRGKRKMPTPDSSLSRSDYDSPIVVPAYFATVGATLTEQMPALSACCTGLANLCSSLSRVKDYACVLRRRREPLLKELLLTDCAPST